MAEAIETTQQIVLSVRVKGDSTGPQTGDVVLGGASFDDFNPYESYQINEVIVYEGNIYRAKEFIPGGDFDKDQWEALTQIMIFLRDYEGGFSYKKDQTVLYSEKLWRAKEDFISTEEFDPTKWEGVDTVDVNIQDFEPRGIYDKYETIVHSSKLYRAKEAFTAGPGFDENDWELINDTIVADFEPNKDYHKNNMIVVSGALYRAKDDFTSGGYFDPDDWDGVAAVGFSDFEAGKYYARGAVISHNDKIYSAKNDFTAGAAFNIGDWETLSDTLAETFVPGTYYLKDHIVFYNGKIYRAKGNFTAGTNFNPADWQDLNPNKIESFAPDTSYYEDQVVIYNGALYRSKADFTSGSTFNPANWDKIGSASLQIVYETSSSDFDDPALVYPTVGKTFKEEIHAPGSDSYLEAFTDNQGGVEELREGAIIQAGASAILTAKKTGTNKNTADFTVKDIDALGKIEVVRDGSNPYMNFVLRDNLDEEMSFRVKKNDNAVTLTSGIQKALTDALSKGTNTQYGVVKTDNVTIKADANSVISAYPVVRVFASNTTYAEGELVIYKNNVYSSKTDFTTGTTWNLNDWRPVNPTVTQYTSGASYSLGDMVYVQQGVHRDLYFCTTAMSSAPATFNASQWHKVEVNGSQVYLSTSGNYVLGSTNTQDAYNEIDMQLYTTVRPYDDTTRYRIITQTIGSTPPAAIAGCTTIVLYTE